MAGYRLNIDSAVTTVTQKIRHFGAELDSVIEAEVEKLLKADHILPIPFPGGVGGAGRDCVRWYAAEHEKDTIMHGWQLQDVQGYRQWSRLIADDFLLFLGMIIFSQGYEYIPRDFLLYDWSPAPIHHGG
ncbi:disease resistance protein [Striga asiatica]|uniref:Disease resistance protein n=1 Tax=Striga asiatica TaxID=4170 RepID=A0A5A7R655_STRAF|nr:disease resistance protein [Striga asiatica]